MIYLGLFIAVFTLGVCLVIAIDELCSWVVRRYTRPELPAAEPVRIETSFGAEFEPAWEWPSNVVPLHTARRSQAQPHLRVLPNPTDAA